MNLAGIDVEAYHAALGAQRGWATVQRWTTERTNAGAGYTTPGGEIPVVSIDDLRLRFCNLILLDVEGAEADVLLGAYLTIQRFRPTIVIEEKHLPQDCGPDDHLEARRFLQRIGYREVAQIHRDVVFRC
jgi:FkbM family methyltransferase